MTLFAEGQFVYTLVNLYTLKVSDFHDEGLTYKQFSEVHLLRNTQ